MFTKLTFHNKRKCAEIEDLHSDLVIQIWYLFYHTCLCRFDPGAREKDRTIVQTLLGASNHFSRQQNSSWFRSTILRLCSKPYGTKPDPTKIEAIRNFPEPKDLTNLRSFFGLSNQFGDFSPDLKQFMEPLKGLLSQKNSWVWNTDHTNAMNKVKEIITGPQCLARFGPKKPIVLITDASRIGLGFVLIQPDDIDEAFDKMGN